jgi:glutathione-regulated potassium-efflux system ancillary protein KefF
MSGELDGNNAHGVEAASGTAVVVVQAHPYPDRSHANRALAAAIEGLAGIAVRSLYDLYPDFAIDVEAEQRALAPAAVVVWQHPLYWYTTPALLKLWFEKVLTAGWAYGPGGVALRGKGCLWVVTTGGEADDYVPDGIHQHIFEAFMPVVRQTALFCGMSWLEPMVVHGAHRLTAAELAEIGARYRACLAALVAAESDGNG